MPTYSLIAAKEECAISPVIARQQNRAADICSKLIQMKLVDPCEGVFSIQSAIAEELPSCSVEVIGSRFGNHVYYAAEYASELRLIVVRIDFEFLDIVDYRRNRISTREALLIIQSIKEKQIAAVCLTVNGRKGKGSYRISGELLAAAILRGVHSTYARSEIEELCEWRFADQLQRPRP